MKALSVLFSLLAGGLLASSPEVDRYGQYTGEDWPGKVTDDSQLKADFARERAELAGVKLDLNRYDRFGGVKDGRPGKSTGFFRVEKMDGRWWLISPEGNRFFLRGVDVIPYSERGYFTNVNGKDGSPRKNFKEGLPDKKNYPSAWHNKDRWFSFRVANLFRKYGPDFHELWMDTTEKRLLSWGFNASGKWNNPFVFDRMPFLLDRRLSLKRFERYLDPFDPVFESSLSEQVKKLCSQYRNNPYLIAYQFENEDGWDLNAVTLLLLDQSGSLEAKRVLLKKLDREKAGTAAKIFGYPGRSLDELMKLPLDRSKLPENVASDFIRDASRRYFSVLHREIRKNDSDHLLFGPSNCPRQPLEWIGESRNYIDVIPLHEYDLTAAWIDDALKAHLRKWDKPYAVLEFSFTNHWRGFAPYGANTIMANDADRGRAFQQYTEYRAADPLCVGYSWFIFCDQPVTGRWSGKIPEAHNFGLVSVVDRPYRDMLAFVEKANSRVFRIHDGKETPVKKQLLRVAFQHYRDLMPESLGRFGFDSSNPKFHNNRVNRIGFFENGRIGIPMKIGKMEAKNGFESLQFRVFLWRLTKNQNLKDWILLEESSDNRNFSKVELGCRLLKPNEFNEYGVTPEKLKPDTRYVRLSFILNDREHPWAVSLAEIQLKRRP